MQLKIFVEKKSRLILYSLDLRTHRGRPSASRTHIPNQDLPPPSTQEAWASIEVLSGLNSTAPAIAIAFQVIEFLFFAAKRIRPVQY